MSLMAQILQAARVLHVLSPLSVQVESSFYLHNGGVPDRSQSDLSRAVIITGQERKLHGIVRLMKAL